MVTPSVSIQAVGPKPSKLPPSHLLAAGHHRVDSGFCRRHEVSQLVQIKRGHLIAHPVHIPRCQNDGRFARYAIYEFREISTGLQLDSSGKVKVVGAVRFELTTF
jgi:hypothetical protein